MFLVIRMLQHEYDEWEEHRIRYAFEEARRLLDLYILEDIRYIEYTSNQSKEVQQYCMMKIWLILDSNGVFMVHHIKKKKNKINVIIHLYDKDDVTDDESDD